MARVFLSERAVTDLTEVNAYSVDRRGQSVADRYLAHFTAALDRLREDPSLLQPRPDISAHLRFYRVEKHWLVCDVIDSVIYVLTVKHGAMDLPSRLAELEPHLAREAELMRRKFQGL